MAAAEFPIHSQPLEGALLTLEATALADVTLSLVGGLTSQAHPQNGQTTKG